MVDVKTTRQGLILILALACLGFVQVAASQPTRPPLKIGVVNLDRLVRESPQAQNAKQNMAKRFAERKDALEAASDALQDKLNRLERNSENMSDEQRNQLQSRIRDDKRQLQLNQSEYNDDVSDAEQSELDAMRSDLREVIDEYARDNGYDLILSDPVLYADEMVDITDDILKGLRQHADAKKTESETGSSNES